MTGRSKRISARIEQVKQFASEGKNVREIAQLLGIHEQLVRVAAKVAVVKLVRTPGPLSIGSVDRNRRMASMYRQGVTLNKIGQQFGITRERVRQVLKKQGITSSDGGKQFAAASQREAATLRAEAQSVLKFGQSLAVMKQLRSDGVVAAYRSQLHSAKSRGVEFKLTFAEWFAIWQTSGKLHLRGRGKGKYVMSRMRDDGCYEIGNVHIQLAEENSRDAVEKWKGKNKTISRGVFMLYPGTAKPWFCKFGRKSLGTHATEEDAVRARAAYIAANGLDDDGGLGNGRGYTVTKRGYFLMQAPNRRSTHKTAEAARAAYLTAIADLRAERSAAKQVSETAKRGLVRSDCFETGVVHGAHFSPRKPLNTTQLIGETL